MYFISASYTSSALSQLFYSKTFLCYFPFLSIYLTRSDKGKILSEKSFHLNYRPIHSLVSKFYLTESEMVKSSWLKKKYIYIYRWSMCRWSFWVTRSPRAIPPERYRMRGGPSSRRNPGFRLKERSPRWLSRARPRRPSSRPEIVANFAACSSSSCPETIGRHHGL